MKRFSLFVLFYSISLSLSFSQVDNSFWFVAPEITEGHGIYPGDEPIFFRITAMDLPAKVTISQPAIS